MRGYSLDVQTVSRTEEVGLSRMSLEDWVALEDDTQGEFVDGWLVEEEVGSYLHELIVAALIQRLRAWALSRGGSVVGSNLKFVLSAERGRKPDVSVFFPGRLPERDATVIRVPPDIAIEVVSPSPGDQRRDRVHKSAEYAAFGVHSFWLIDARSRTLEIFELGVDGRYTRVSAATEGEIDVPGCEGLRLDLTEIWAEVDSQMS
ncbi:MAG: Uma2 family endonuclease [Myxococcaceae bacterium]